MNEPIKIDLKMQDQPGTTIFFLSIRQQLNLSMTKCAQILLINNRERENV